MCMTEEQRDRLAEAILNEFDGNDDAVVRKGCGRFDLDEKYDWKNGEFKNCPIRMPAEGSIYERNVYLKDNLMKGVEDEGEFVDKAMWAINVWGGIGGFRTRSKLSAVWNNARSGHFELGLDSISSLSKALSFLRPAECAIYDYRVVSSLNWIIRRHNLECKYFPIGARVSRNSHIVNCGRDVERTKMIGGRHAYSAYCDLLKRVSELSGNRLRIHDAEMFLFVIAGEEIMRDMSQAEGTNSV